MTLPPPGMRPLYPAVAAALGFLFPGGGQIYCGQRTRGAIILAVACITLFGCGLWNLYGAWSGWFLAGRLKFAPPLSVRGGTDVAEVVSDAFD
jgi:TM2 domain-containing membrane protein YozV